MSCGEHGKAVKTECAPEPWEALPENDVDGEDSEEFVIYDANGMMVCLASKANARRSVACVNACAGIDIDALEIIHSNGPYPESDLWMRAKAVQAVAMYKEAQKQRDELLSAIADHVGSIDPESENRAYDDLRAAYDMASVKADHFRGVTKMMEGGDR